MEKEMPLFWPEKLVLLEIGQCLPVPEFEVPTVYNAMKSPKVKSSEIVMRFTIRTDPDTGGKYVWRLEDRTRITIYNT